MTTLAMDNQNGFTYMDSVFNVPVYEIVWNRSLPASFSPSSTSLSSSINTALSFLGSNNVTIENRILVEDFLANNFALVAHLYEAPQRVVDYFDFREMELGVFSDPDSSEDPEIYLEIATSLSPEDANARLSELNREWVLFSNDEDLMKLNFTLKFL